MKIYFDNSATTPVSKEVLRAMLPYFSEKYGNASSLHELGRESSKAAERARKEIAKFLNVEPEEIIFTSGGTESNNFAIKGLALANPSKKHIITSKIEHPSVIEVCKELEERGYAVDYISVDKEGIVDVEEIKKKINPKTLLVSIMHVNNEVGAIQPIEKIAEICEKYDTPFHTDAVQSFGKIPINASKFTMLSASAHKINGPKGIGLLYVKKGTLISQLLNGGGQENELRSGTENIPAIIGFAKAVEISKSNIKRKDKIKKIKDKIIGGLLEIPGSKLNGSKDKRIYTNVNISFENVEGEALVLLLDEKGIATSTGSACSANNLKPSPVLLAMGLSPLQAHSSLRIALGFQNTEKEADYLIKETKNAVEKLRKMSKIK